MDQASQEVGLTRVATFVVWAGCIVVGIRGLIVSRVWRTVPPPPPPTVQAELITPQLTNQTAAPRVQESSPEETVSAAPPPPAEVSFPDPALPPVHPVNTPAISAAPTIHLTFGEGEGIQPAPFYPAEAQLDGEEGTVGVLFNVDEEGRVTSAQAYAPCKWPLLNEAALQAIQDTWRFRPGPKRRYKVSIEFVMKKPQ